MKTWKISLQLLVVVLLSACSKDEVNLTQIKATYVQIQEPTHINTKYGWVPEYGIKNGTGIIDDWTSYVVVYFDDLYSSLPDEIQVQIGTHTEQEKDYYWVGYNQYYQWKDVEVADYVYCNYSLEWDETIKEFILFKGKGLCEVITERYTKNLVLKKNYLDYSFKGNAELEAKYAADVRRIGTTETTKLIDTKGDKKIFDAQYAVNNYGGTSDSGAEYYMHAGTDYIDLYMESENTIHPIQKIPHAADWGTYTLTTTESPSLL